MYYSLILDETKKTKQKPKDTNLLKINTLREQKHVSRKWISTSNTTHHHHHHCLVELSERLLRIAEEEKGRSPAICSTAAFRESSAPTWGDCHPLPLVFQEEWHWCAPDPWHLPPYVFCTVYLACGVFPCVWSLVSWRGLYEGVLCGGRGVWRGAGVGVRVEKVLEGVKSASSPATRKFVCRGKRDSFPNLARSHLISLLHLPVSTTW